MAVESQTGKQHGGVIAVAMPKTAVEATELAESLVSECLPHSMLCWLQNMEYHQLVAASVGGNPPPPPEKTPELVEAVSQSVKSLTELLKPAHIAGRSLKRKYSRCLLHLISTPAIRES
ncbi:hypothetical protein [Rhizobium ruizarguesonis]|uniref:hypothetical protein n=1 Tax=Rhizobium ruizarguesonis TaxID=2081791 RepID=UPI001FEE5B21|nr:hypothetical protein [Rhizobium ruizarguesonis]